MGAKDFMDRVKGNQAKVAPIIEVKISLMPGGQVQVARPEGNEPEKLAAVLELMATGMVIVSRKLGEAKTESGRIVVPPPGMKVN